MDEQELEFDLEDILKEFAPDSQDNQEAQESQDIRDTQDPPESPAADAPVEEVPAQAAPEAPKLSDTQTFQPISQEPPEDGSLEKTQRFQAVTDASPAETFTQTWEPEYEEPFGEYIPPQPIIFRPRSRLRELKRKLIEGPEKRYYELTEIGVGRLQVLILVSLLVVLLSAGATALQALGYVPQTRLKLMVFFQFFVLLLSALLGSFQLLEGLMDLTRKKVTLNTLLVFTFAACVADGILCLTEQRIPCCAAFSLQVTMSLWATYHKRVTRIGQMDTMRKATRLDSLAIREDYYEGQAGILRGEGQVEDFMDHYDDPTGPESATQIYALVALLVSAALGITAGILHGLSTGLQVLAVSLIAAVPATFFITLSRPEALTEKRLHKLGTVLCGWQGIRGLCRRVAYPVDFPDLFPGTTAKMNGVKFYGHREPDQVVAYATALIEADSNALAPLFTALLDSRNGRHYDVDQARRYNGGLGALIEGEPVLVGTLTFLKEMGVEIPEGTRVNQAVYIAVDGELCGLFALSFDRDRAAAAGLGTLCSYRGLKPVLIARDFILGESFVRSKFATSTRRMAFPEREVREELRAKELEPNAPALALTTQLGLAPAAYAATSARSLRTASILGVSVHMVAGSLGLIIMLILAILGQTQLLTPANLFLYELLWMIPGLLISEWGRSA